MPLLGSYGGSSEYAYRGTIDDFPNDFSFTNLNNVSPGEVYTSETITITGINNKAVVNVSAGSSVSIDGGPFVFTSEESPVFVENNQTITVSIVTTSGSIEDFNKTYSSNVRVGRKSAIWSLTTRGRDETPDPIAFVNLTNQEIGIAYTSNEVTISGIDAGFPLLASITSGNGQISINGGSLVSSGSVVNGDRIYLRLNSPFEYSNFPTGSGIKSNQTTIQVGSFTTSWSVSARDVDVFIDPFDFNDINNAVVSSVFTAQSVNSLGVVTSISGADQGIPLVTAVSGCELRVEQPSPSGVGFLVRRDFSTSNAIVFNGDRLTVRLTSGSNFSETKVGIVTVSNFTGKFIVTTRPRPVDTIPDSFSGQFIDLSNQVRNTLVESNEVTLVGMSTFSDEGVASITTGLTGGNAQFQVTRNGVIVKQFSNSNFNVRNGDKIKLRITSSNTPNGTVNATFRVDGTDTSFILSGRDGFQDDIWIVATAPRVCDITPFTLATINDADVNTQFSRTFTVSGFETDCGMKISTSNPNSFLSIPGRSGSNNLSVFPGETVTVFMTSGNFLESRTTTITVSNSSSGVDPSRTYTTTWTINSKADTRNTTVSLSANPTSFTPGQSVTLTWSSVNAASIVSSSGSGFNPTTTSGTAVVFPTASETYSITVVGPPSAGNFPQQITSTARVLLVEDTTPDNFSLNPSSYTDQTISSIVNFRARSSANSSVSVTGLTPGVSVNAVVTANSTVFMTVNGVNRGTSFSVQNNDVIEVFLANSSVPGNTVSGSLSIGSVLRTFRSTTLEDTTPDSFSLSPSSYTNQNISSIVNFRARSSANSSVSVTGLTPGTTVNSRVTANSTVFMTVNGVNRGTSFSVQNNDVIEVFLTNSSVPNTTVSGSLFIGSTSRSFSSNTSQDITPDSFSLNPPSYINQNTSSQVTFRAQSSANSSVSVTGLTPGVSVTASVTTGSLRVNGVNRGNSFSVQNSDVIEVLLTNSPNSGVTLSGTLSIGTVSANFSSTTTSCSVGTGSITISSGVQVNGKNARVTYQNGVTTTESSNNSLYVSRSGFNLFQACRPATTGTKFFTTNNGSYTIPPGVTEVRFGCVGPGGGGSATAGGGGGGLAAGIIPVNSGDVIDLLGGSIRLNVRPIAGGGIGGFGGTPPSTPFINSPAFGDTWNGNPAFGLPGGNNQNPSSGVPGRSAFANNRPGAGGGGGGTFFTESPGGGIIINGRNGPNAQAAGGTVFAGAAARFGGGGGAAGFGAFGPQNPTSGAPGSSALFYQSTGSPAITWDQLIGTIVSAFNSFASRPPKLSEIQSFSNSFISNSSLSLDSLRSNISNTINSSNRASSFTDECGGSF